jgi:hypothetical protein
LRDPGVDENNIKIDFKDIEYRCVDWIHLAKDRDM